MSFGIAIRWVYVDGQRTRYCEVLAEAAALRAELAELRSRTAAAQAADLPELPDLHAIKGEEALLEWVSWARSNIAGWRTQASEAARTHVARQLAAAAPPPRERASAAAQLAELRRRGAPLPAPPERPAAGAQERRRAAAAARQLAEDNAGDIAPADTEKIAALIAELDALDETAPISQIRAARHAAELTVHDAVRRGRARAHTQRTRHNMRTQAAALVDDPAERAALLRDIDAAADPAALQPRLEQARAHASAPTDTRARVARAAAEALTEIGCHVHPAASDTLTNAGEVVAPLPERPDCAVRLRLAPQRDQVSVSLVRYAATAASPAADTEAQTWFCAHKHPPLMAALKNATPQLAWVEKLRLEPGDRPLPALAPPPQTEHAPTEAAARHRHH